MKKAVMGLIGAMMVFSLAACTPTTEKNKTGEVKQLETGSVTSTQGPGVVTDRGVYVPYLLKTYFDAGEKTFY